MRGDGGSGPGEILAALGGGAPASPPPPGGPSGLRKEAGADYVSFWEGQASRLSWFKKWDRARDWSPPFARWFVGGRINASHNALDVHAARDPSRTALVW